MTEFERMLAELQGVSKLQRAPALQRDPNAFKPLDKELVESNIYTAIQKKLNEQATVKRQAVADANARNYVEALKKGEGLLSGVQKNLSTVVDDSINAGGEQARVLDARTTRKKTVADQNNMLQAALGTPTKAPTFLDNLIRVGSGMGQTPGVSFASDFIGSSQRDRARTAATSEKEANRAIQAADLAEKRAQRKEEFALEKKIAADNVRKFTLGGLSTGEQENKNKTIKSLLADNEDIDKMVKQGFLGKGENAITSIAQLYTQIERLGGDKNPRQILLQAVQILNSDKKDAPVDVNTGMGPKTIIKVGATKE